MNRDDIIRMAREAGFETANEWERHPNGFFVVVSRFAALVAAAEQDRCKPLAEEEIARLVTNDMVKFARAIERAHGIGGQP